MTEGDRSIAGRRPGDTLAQGNLRGMKRLAERIAQHRHGAAPAAVGSLWPLVAGVAIAWFLQQWIAPAIGPLRPNGSWTTFMSSKSKSARSLTICRPAFTARSPN